VAEQLLDRLQVRAAIQEVGREAVAERMGGDVGWEAGPQRPPLENVLDRPSRERTTLRVQKQRRFVPRPSFAAYVSSDRVGTGLTEEGDPLL